MSRIWAWPRSIVPIERLKLSPLTLIFLAQRCSQASLVTLEWVSFPAVFALLTADREAEQSRRDDLESLGYILLYFLRGRLPWAQLEAETKAQKYELMMEVKKNIDIDELCDQVPREFADCMDHVRALKFEDKPDYSYLRRVFRKLFIRRRFEYDNVFDWTIKRYMEQQETQCGE
jgi:hypothetical protein